MSLTNQRNLFIYPKTKRLFDLLFSLLLFAIFFLPMVIISILIIRTSNGPLIYWSKRIGINNKIFKMPKFRTMLRDTPVIASHLLNNPNRHITPMGMFLRKYSLDELPQLWSILKGDMSFVGPRPALFNQYDLVKLRTEGNVHKIKPGITGLAQINGRDTLTIPKKVMFDIKYLKYRSFILDLKIIIITIKKVFISSDVRH